jgi:hypothetical protein
VPQFHNVNCFRCVGECGLKIAYICKCDGRVGTVTMPVGAFLLEGLFAEDVVSYSDGGGVVRTAARAPVSGRERVAKFISAFASHFWTGMTLAWVEANGQASVLMSRDGIPVALATIDASAEGIDKIMWIMRPSKLAVVATSRLKIG